MADVICRMQDGEPCYTRKSELHVLSGGLLEFWKRLHDVSQCSDFIGRVYYTHTPHSSGSSTMRVKKRLPLEIVRLVTDTGDPIVGYKAVSEQEMEFFKTQMLLPHGHPDDIVVKKHGTVGANKKNGTSGSGKKRRFTLSDRHDAPGW